MREIKYLAQHIEEELEDAEEYAKAAYHYREKDRELSQTLCELSRQELEHVNMLHNQALRLIRKQREAGITPPAVMEEIWAWEHEKMTDKIARVNQILQMAKQ